MTSKIIVNTIEADTGISSVTFASNINLQNDSSVLVSSSGVRLGTGSTIAAPSANEITLSTNSAERLRLTSAGNLGLGTNNPDKLLTVSGSNTVSRFKSSTSYVDLLFQNDTKTNGFIQYNSSGNFNFYADSGSTPTLTITGGAPGKIGVGVTSPSQMMEITNTGSTGSQIQFRDTSTASGTNNGVRFGYNGSGAQIWNFESTFIRFATSNAERVRITPAGNVGINVTNPERKLEVVDTAGSLTFPVAVSNHTDASAGVGAGIAFHLTAGGNTRGDFGVVYAGNSNSDGTDFVFRPNDGSTGSVERLRIEGSSGRVGINTNSAAARLDISHPHTEKGLVVRSRYGNIATAMVKFDSDPDSNGGDGNVLHLHGGSSRTDSEILHIDSTGVGDIFDIRGDGLTRVYKHLQLEHASNTAKIIFNEFGANDPKAQIEMDQINGSNGQLRFYTEGNGTLSERMRITNAGHVLKSDTPAFKCKLSGATGANFTGVLVFNSVQYNIGSHYNSSNGRFTAPVDGRYLFAWYTNMERAGGNGSFYADWMINGNNQGNRMYTHHSGAWEQICGTVIFDLNANDYVQINAITSGNWDGGSYGSYSGYLLG